MSLDLKLFREAVKTAYFKDLHKLVSENWLTYEIIT